MPSTWHCIVTAVPMPATSHQPVAPPDHARHAAASATALERAMRFGFQMKVDSSTAAIETAIVEAGHEAGDRPTDRACQPPDDPDGRDARQGDEGDHGQRRVATGQGRGRTQQVVVPGAVVDVADRGGRTEERDHAIADEGPQDEHVVALVGVPRPTGREAGETGQRGEDQEQGERESIEGRWDPQARLAGVRHAGVRHAGAVLARALPTSSKAPGGRSARGWPAARARARVEVDGVVALVHARGLQHVGGVRQAGMAQDVGQAGRPDQAGREVLVAVDPRPALGARVVEMDHDQPRQADPGVEGGQ